MKVSRRIRRATERPTWLPVQVEIGKATYRVYPSGTVYRLEGNTQHSVNSADADFVIRRVIESQAERTG